MTTANNDGPWALSAIVSDQFLNAMALTGLGGGVVVDEFRQSFGVPMMGTVELAVSMTITEVHFEMRAADRGKLRATVSAAGHVRLLGDVPVDLPGPARVRGEVLVSPRVRVGKDGSFTAVLDLPRSKLVATHFDGVDGIDADADALAQMGEMLFTAVGGELFAGLAERMGVLGLQLDGGLGQVFLEAGCRPGPAKIRVGDGRMFVGLAAIDGLDGDADPGEPEGVSLGVGVAAGALSVLASRVVEDRLGLPLPLELEVTAHERRVGTVVRNRRLVDTSILPDLRANWRTTLRPRLIDDQIEIGLRAAWVEVPFLPPVVNQVSRWFGGAASRAPLAVRVPSRTAVPVRPGSEHLMAVAVSRLDVGEHGVHLVIDAHL